MEIQKNKQGQALRIVLSGRLDNTTAPMLEESIQEDIHDIKELDFDLAGLEYISSAGLRVILYAQKIMNKQGKMTISHPNSFIREIFDITGFSDILTLLD